MGKLDLEKTDADEQGGEPQDDTRQLQHQRVRQAAGLEDDGAAQGTALLDQLPLFADGGCCHRLRTRPRSCSIWKGRSAPFGRRCVCYNDIKSGTALDAINEMIPWGRLISPNGTPPLP